MSLVAYSAGFGRPIIEIQPDLESFCALIAKWNRSQNLVSRETAANLWDRHIIDSLQLVPLIRQHHRKIVDLGSGGGFPAIPLAIAVKGRSIDITMIEANSRKTSFLRAACRELNLPHTSVLNERIEIAAAQHFPPPDVITSRALAPLPLLFTLAQPLFGPETRAIFHKGREYGDELREADASWHFDVLKHRSDTNPEAVLLEISNLSRRG